MKNHVKRGLLALVLCLLQPPICSMQVNYGVETSYNLSISTYKYINHGVVKGLNDVTIDVSSLTGNGTISASHNIDIKSDYFGYTGPISAGENCGIKVKTFEENSTIKSPNITITCDEFKFSGVISCEKECMIYAKKSFNTNMFKREGHGIFKVIISPYDVEYFSQEDLLSKSYRDFCDNCLNLDEHKIDSAIKKIRTHAVLNGFDDKALLKDIKLKLEEKINFHKERLQEQQDTDSLYAGLTKCGISAVGLLAACAMFKNEQTLTAKFRADAGTIKIVSVMAAVISSLPAFFSYSDFYTWRNPCHQEKYDGYSLIVSRIDHALLTERVPEEQIINL